MCSGLSAYCRLVSLQTLIVIVCLLEQSSRGPSIKYVTLFLANYDPPLPLSHFVTHPGTPKSTSHISDPQIFSRPSMKTRRKAPCTNSLSIVRGGFCPGAFVKGSIVWNVLSGVVFVRSPFC